VAIRRGHFATITRSVTVYSVRFLFITKLLEQAQPGRQFARDSPLEGDGFDPSVPGKVG
jgi:hypothetical protein